MNDYHGLREDVACTAALNDGFVVRIISRDGNPFTVTRDHRSDRVNFTIVDQIIVKADVG